MLNLKEIVQFVEAYPKIAYFSMEIGLDARIPTYSGGLGVLAGDTLKAAADIKLPMVGVTLLYKEGFFKQILDEQGNQTEDVEEWDPHEFMEVLPNRVQVKIEGRLVNLQAWKHEIKSASGGVVPIYYMDSDLEDNAPEDREITKRLYSGDPQHRLRQEVILGIGGVRMLENLGFDKIEKFHMNEGHAALLTLELLKHGEEKEVRDVCVFTTHTPVPAGHDRFDYGTVQAVLDSSEFSMDMIKKYAGKKDLNMTTLAISLSGFVNGVSKKHSIISMNMFPGTKVWAITNGIHSNTWTSPELAEVFDAHLEDWRTDPFNLRNAALIPGEKIWNAHQKSKKILLDYVKNETGVEMGVDIFTIGFARRATGYKRATLLFRDLERLKSIANEKGAIQVLYAGKSHPADGEGKELIKGIFSIKESLGEKIKVVFLENYNMDVAKKLVAGVDVWLNTPARPREASGTSGMKAAHNGVPNFSVLDGWWIEGHVEGVTGWGIGNKPTETTIKQAGDDEGDANDIYEKLSNVILPLYYSNRDEWINVMKNAIALNGSFFTTRRMVLQYVAKAYM